MDRICSSTPVRLPICVPLCSELGLNPKKARRAGLLHDIGKVPDEEPELPHAILGMKIAERCKEKPEICNAIGAHHDEVEQTTLLAPIVQVVMLFQAHVQAHAAKS